MDSTRFIPRLEEIEGRFNPAPMSPDAIFAAQTFAAYDAQLVHWQMGNLATAHAVGNQALTLAVDNEIIATSTGIADILNAYAVELQTEKAAANPMFGGFFDQYIALNAGLAATAQMNAAAAQGVVSNVNAYNAGLTAAGTGTGATGLGGTGLGATGTSGSLVGVGTGVTTTGTTTTGTSTVPTAGGSLPGTTGGTTTPVGSGTGTGGTGGSTGTTTPGSPTTGIGSSTPGASATGTNGTSG